MSVNIVIAVKMSPDLCGAVDARVSRSIFSSRNAYIKALIRRDLANNQSTSGLTRYHIVDPYKQDAFDAMLLDKHSSPKTACNSAS